MTQGVTLCEMLLISKMAIAELGPKFTRKNVFPLNRVFLLLLHAMFWFTF